MVKSKATLSWTHTAFMIEALVLLFVLVASLAVFTSLFIYSIDRSQQAERLSNATILAQNAAEEFSANPAAIEADTNASKTVRQANSEFTVSYDITKNNQPSGALYRAHIAISDNQGEAYALDVTRYVEGVS